MNGVGLTGGQKVTISGESWSVPESGGTGENGRESGQEYKWGLAN